MRHVRKEPDAFPLLHSFLTAETTAGARVDCDQLSDDVARLWSRESGTERYRQLGSWSILMAFTPTVMHLRGMNRFGACSRARGLRSVCRSSKRALH